MGKAKAQANPLSSIKRVLIVEDDEALRRAVARLVRTWGADVDEAPTLQDAISCLDRNPDVLMTDVALPDGDALQLLEVAAQRRPAPIAIAFSGAVTTEEAFRLAQLGCRAYLQKPFELEALTAKVEQALKEAPKLDSLVASSVGRVPLKELQGEVRRVMVEQALARAEGSRSGAARLLSVSRQAVQQMVREREGGEGGLPEDPDDDE